MKKLPLVYQMVSKTNLPCDSSDGSDSPDSNDISNRNDSNDNSDSSDQKTVFINYKKFHKKNLISHQNLFTIKKTEITRKKIKNSLSKTQIVMSSNTQILMKLKLKL